MEFELNIQVNAIRKSIVPRKFRHAKFDAGGDLGFLSKQWQGNFGHFWLSLNLLNMPSIRVGLSTFRNLSPPSISLRPSLWRAILLFNPSRGHFSHSIEAFIMIYSHKPLLTFYGAYVTSKQRAHCYCCVARRTSEQTLWASEHDSINQMLFWLVLRCFSPWRRTGVVTRALRASGVCASDAWVMSDRKV